MRSFPKTIFYGIALFLTVFCASRASAQSLFTPLSSSQTGITFQNALPETPELNIITYEYYYNGGGVGVGDFNNDGLPDLYFTANVGPNKLYLNKGGFQFEDISKRSGTEGNKGWKTGVSIADVNGDGWLDIYVCYSGNLAPEKRKNQLFINNGNLTFTDRAAEMGLDDPGHSTMAAFFDMDQDGDLDAYVLNHNVKQFRNFDAAFVKTQVDPDAGDRLYENREGKFFNITQQAGIKSNPLGYGLGLNVSDINNDGWPDIYVSNDYVEEDYLYLNNQNGTFREVLKEQIPHISNFSMGLDVADINNDGWMDIFTLDMLPRDNERQKLLYAPDNFELYNNMVDNGFHHQLMRNMLHLNNGNGTFSEIGQYAGISNTDWSWAALFADYNNDGFKDLFVTNGYGRDMINRDFMKFYADERLKHLQGKTDDKMFGMLQSIRSTPLQNYIFENTNGTRFTDRTIEWGLEGRDFSHGAAYADFDNDGDLDLVFNRMNAPAGVYKNMAIENSLSGSFIRFELLSETKNTRAIGAKVSVFTPKGTFHGLNFPVHGFQSSMALPLHIGLPVSSIDSILIQWPSGSTSCIKTGLTAGKTHILRDADACSRTPVAAGMPKTVFSIPADTLNYLHKELMVNDFKVQPMIPNMVSYHGPEMARGDINGDGLDDLYICGPEGQAGMLYLQLRNETFIPSNQPALMLDARFEDAYAVFFDADGDKDQDLYVVSGGYGATDSGLPLQDRLYLNNGGMLFSAPRNVLPDVAFSGSVAVPWDFDRDGDLDLFVGARVEQGNYPLAPASILLENNGKGSFTISWQKNLGMVTHALAADFNGDGREELAVCGEWTSLMFFDFGPDGIIDISEKVMPKKMIGWWNILHHADLDGDGDLDLIAGNWGQNAQFKPSDAEPVELFYADFDANGFIDPMLCYYIEGVPYPFASRDEITDQMVGLRKNYVTYDSYSRATLPDILGKPEMEKSPRHAANCLETLWFENQNGTFVPHSLPEQANYAPVHAILTDDFDGDGKMDILLAGNVEYTRIRIGRTDANYGCLLKGGIERGTFQYVPQLESGLNFHGAVRSMKQFRDAAGKVFYIVGINNRKPLILKPEGK